MRLPPDGNRFPMKFRLVWVGSDDDRSKQSGPREGVAALADAALRSGYEQQKGVMLRRERMQNGRVRYTALANFNARIVSDILRDDGEQERREFGIEAQLEGCNVTISLSASEFGRMNWVLHRLGPQAIVYPGQHQHARAAIQWFSGPIRQERIFTHLGWRKHGTQHIYLHTSGALGAGGPISDVQVQLPSALQLFQVQSPGDSSERVQSIRASLRCLSLAPDRVIFPLLTAVYRAPLGKTDFSMFLVGKTGVFKTALAALCQQHFGSAMDAAHLPGHFASTANALESLAFHAKDALLVVDDFAPTGRHGDDGLENIAERLFRAVGNQQGRSRIVGNGRLQQARPPRALVLATGEKVPKGQSIRARIVIVEVALGEVDRIKLSECQRAGNEAHLAASMGAFLVGSPAVTTNYSSASKCGLVKSVAKDADARFMPVSRGLWRSCRADLSCGWSLLWKLALSVPWRGWSWSSDASGPSRSCQSFRLATTKSAILRSVLSAC